MENHFLETKRAQLIVIILVLYLVILLGTQISLTTLNIHEPFRSFAELGIYALFWFVIIPVVMKIPNGKISIPQYFTFSKLNLFQSPLKLIVYGLGFGLAYLIILGVSTSLIYGTLPDFQEVVSHKLLWGNIAAFFEEFAIRGIILSILLYKNPPSRAVLYSAIIFSAGHIIGIFLGNSITLALYMVGYAFILGLVFARLVIISGSLIPSILLHMIINSISPAFLVQLTEAKGQQLVLVAGIGLYFLTIPLFRKKLLRTDEYEKRGIQ